ncbi:DinB family protein [Hymenobacter properus]|uniref:DinB family protein n=1 Tax=Hymenobacter properus TaxID=2791026 RepID=A0A931BK06_9BACT|nr:DinB family protein [Hymenobacter properus]MBF9143961.1 DinB family protein [Hymenobacter properus]MBR7722776.1 DinB family protein [Microvirga sp. SRT04]
MNHRLHLKLEQLERATEHLLASAEALGADSEKAPAPGSWSAKQVVHHLLFIEGNIIQYIQKKLQAEEALPNVGLLTRLRAQAVRFLLRLPGFKVKAPRGVATLTDAGNLPALPELRDTWDASRRQLERLLNEFPSRQLNRAIFPHPRSGRINIYQVMEFLLDHLLHHQQQMDRITKALRPGAAVRATAEA